MHSGKSERSLSITTIKEGCSNPYIYGGTWIYTRLGKLSEKDLDNFECIIESCSGRYSDDSPVSVILIEEMPAYFLGQKDLDSVIKIAQDRIQKVLDERGREFRARVKFWVSVLNFIKYKKTTA